MSGGNLSPRQQMIGLMYLVLLAMLAMNASKDLLNAFVFLENGIDITTSNFNDANHSVYTKISNSAALGSEIAIKTKNNSDQILEASNSLFDLLDKYKSDIIELGGGLDPETNIPLGKDDANVGAQYLLVSGNGEKLKKELLNYKNLLGQFIDKRDTIMLSSLDALLNTPDHIDYEKNTIPWENNISEHLPLAAVTANLTNLQSYVRNAESQVINYLFEEINLDTYKVNKIMATSIAKSGYILQGDKYSANIFLAAADTTQEPIVIVGDYDTAIYRSTGTIKFISETDTLPVDAGIGNYNVNTNITGNHAWGGIMKVPHPNPKRKGEFLIYPFVNAYTVAAPSAVISSKDLNIMYKGIGNKIEISAPGISSDKIIPIANSCSIVKSGTGQYKITPNRLGKIKIQVFAEITSGKRQLMGEQEWIVKSFPKPLLFIGSEERPVKMKRNKLFAIGGINLRYSPDFPVSAKPKAVNCSFEMYDKDNNFLRKGNMPSGKFKLDDKNYVRGLRVGTSIFIKTKGVGPDGIKKKISEQLVKIIR
jgi:gliding motility-associated protein GldM